MTAIKISTFGGEFPAALPRALPQNASQLSSNLHPRTTEFRPLQADASEATSSVGSPATIYKYQSTWVSSSQRLSFVRGQIDGDALDRTFYSFEDGTPPRVIDSTASVSNLATAGRQLGVPAPTNAPGVEVMVADEFSSEDLSDATDAAISSIEAVVESALKPEFSGNAIPFAAPSSRNIGWAAHDAGYPSVGGHQWNLLVPMNGSTPAVGFEYLQRPEFGGAKVGSYWAVPFELWAPIVTVDQKALSDGLTALKSPYDPGQSLLDKAEVASIVADSVAYWATTTEPQKSLVDSALAATGLIRSIIDKTNKGSFGTDFYTSKAFTDAFNAVVGTDTTSNFGHASLRIVDRANALATKSSDRSSPAILSDSGLRYFKLVNSPSTVYSNVRSDINSCVTTNAAGEKTFDAAKLTNLLTKEFDAIIRRRPSSEEQRIYLSQLNGYVLECIKPLTDFFSIDNLIKLGYGVDSPSIGDALLTAMADASVALRVLRDKYASMASTGARQTALNAFNLGAKSRFSEDVVTRVIDTRFYVCTYVTDRGEESAPSPVSAMVEVDQNDQVLVTCPIPPSGRYVRAIRVYRTNTGTNTSDFQFAFQIDRGVDRYFSTYADVASAYTTDSLGLSRQDFAWEHYRKHGLAESRKSPAELAEGSPVTSDSHWLTTTNRQYTDSQTGLTLGEVLPTTTWLEPPAGLKGLVGMPNGILAGFVGNTVSFCEPFLPYAWPVAYQLTTEHPIVGLAVFGQTLVVCTEGFPYFISGADSASMSAQKLNERQACTSAASIVSVDGGVVFASPDGLCLCSGNGIQMLTSKHFTREDWQLLDPKKIKSAYHDGVIYFTNGAKTYALDPPTGNLGRVDLRATAFYSDLLTDSLYAASGTSIVKLFSTGRRKAVWKSKLMVLPSHAGFGWLCVESDFAAGAVVVKWYGDGALVHTATVESRAPVRLPPGRFLEHEFEIESSSRVNSVTVASSGDELRGV